MENIKNNIFISYSRTDKVWLDKLEPHLKALKRIIDITIWDDTKIQPGANWKEEIVQALEKANVAILLVSKNFLASDFIADEELPKILEKASSRGVEIFWILLSSCLFEETELSKYQAAHNTSKAIDGLPESEQEEIFTSVCKKIKEFLCPVVNESVITKQSLTKIEDKKPEESRQERALEYYKSGIKCIEIKNYLAALSAFNEAIVEDDSFAKAYCNRGFVRIELDELREAITDFEKAIKLDPNLWEAHHSLGILHIANKQKAKGCECLKIAKSFDMSESENAFNKYCS